ncbi:CcmD family protein [Alicyclobacillus ferrooxydans]|uniref:CcmD family protein n=1 Tax=Alicyclobacillus ferrooxydans TaxID=471514 RepID=UPI0009F9F211|nr:CcmD family protein [Alicyclobacillus ferrooxydans]
MQQLGYLWGVTAVVWLGTALYIVSLMRRQHKLQQELQQVEKSLSDLRHQTGRE